MISNLWATSDPQQYRFRNINRDQGLSSGEVLDIMKDSKGFMWFGTMSGLNRWDGRNMRAYYHHPMDSSSISDSRISALAETPDGSIWVGTYDNGLSRLDPQREVFKRYLHNPDDSTSLPGNDVTALQVDLQGRLWIGTQDGLCRLDSGFDSFISFHHDSTKNSSIPNDWITALEVDSEGTMWFGTHTSQIFYLEPNTEDFNSLEFKWFKPTGFGTNLVSDLCADPKGEYIWASIAPLGTFRYSKLTGEVTTYRTATDDPYMINKNAIFSLDIAQDGTIWLGNLNGVSLLNPETGQYEFLVPDDSNPNSINSPVVSSILIDPEGIIWLGSRSVGIDVCNPQQLRFDLLNTSHGFQDQFLPANPVLGLDTDESGRIWISTVGGGFIRMNFLTGDSRHFQTDDSSPAIWSMNYGNKIMVDHLQRVWMGTFSAGLFRWDPETESMDHYRKTRRYDKKLNNNDIYALYETKDGTVWVGTEGGGLNHYLPETDEFEYFKHDVGNPQSLCDDNIRTILEDSRGELWIGTGNAGLDRMNRSANTFEHFPKNTQTNFISSFSVLTLHEDSRSVLWIGTGGGGLCRLDSARETFDLVNLGLDSGQMKIYGILEDDNGLLWLSTSLGILKFHTEEGLLGTYQASDGVQNQEFYYDSRLKDQNGYMYFGGVGGLNRFHPDSIGVNNHIPPIELTNLWVNHERAEVGEEVDGRIILPKSIEYMDTLRLSYRDKVLRFDFAALDYWNPNLNQYQYMLENFDPEWVNIGNVNSVTYTSLDPGWYSLRIQGSNNDRIWNKVGVQLAIYIKPPFWQSTGFRVFMVLFILSVFLLIMWLRNWRLRVQNQKLEALVRQRTAELKVEMEERSRVELEKTEQQIEHLRRELLTKTLHLSEKQSIMDNIQDNLQSLSSEVPPDSRGSIRKLLRYLKSHMTVKQDWQDFELWFTEVHSGFYEDLRTHHPNLSENELKVCALLRLNLVTKDVAKVMNIQTTSINIYRHRIRKKINLQSEENLTTYLSQF